MFWQEKTPRTVALMAPDVLSKLMELVKHPGELWTMKRGEDRSSTTGENLKMSVTVNVLVLIFEPMLNDTHQIHSSPFHVQLDTLKAA